MKKYIFCLVSVLFLAGCGHNVATHSKGWGVDLSWNPDSIIPNVRVGYWDVSYAMVRENAEVEIKSDAGLAGDAKGSSDLNSDMSGKANGTTSSEIKLKTGGQINRIYKRSS